MASLSGTTFITGNDLYAAETSASQQLGQIAWDGKSGKAFRYSLNGASALVKGNLVQEAANDVQFDALAVGTAGVAGDLFLQLTNGTTTLVPTAFRGGQVYCNTAGAGVAVGDEYTIVDVTGTLTTGGALNVWTDRPLRFPYATTTTKVGLSKSPWSGVIQMPATTQTGMVVGGAIHAIPASTSTIFQFGWVQTHGAFAALSDNSTMAIGTDIGTVTAQTAAGAAGVYQVATTHHRVGIARHAAENTKAIPVFLQID